MTQIVGQRFADVLRDRQVIGARPGAPNAELSRRPIEIVEPQRDDFPGPQPQPGEQQQNRPIAATDRRLPFTARQQALQFVRRQRPWQRGHRPIRHRRHADPQVALDEPAVTRVLQQRTQRRGHQLGALGMMKPRRFPLYETHHVHRLHQIEPDFAIPDVLGEKRGAQIPGS